MFRRSFIVIIVLALALTSFASVGAQDSYTIGLSLSTFSNPFFVTLRDGAQAFADGIGWGDAKQQCFEL